MMPEKLSTVTIDSEDYTFIMNKIEECLRAELGLPGTRVCNTRLIEAARERIESETKKCRHHDFSLGFIPLYERLCAATQDVKAGKYFVSFASA